ncbi:flagellin [Alteribacillus iranensis]|uniref:Flagellin n=1 Tax=Alteribacillus iranensis TaxID=930128 RepID=A0A1I2B7W3_9BACI|nr:flagellin [Alteribacillus iranensis]
MIINNNIPALNTYRQMGINNQANQNSMEKLSSGLRINKAGDDAAGLAISEKMRAQVRGLDQASRNSQDGISMIQTAEGSLQETHNILQRMRELATQASNDTNVEVDREEIQKEMNQLSSEINRIGNTTEFNTQKLLKGDGGVKLEGIGIDAASLGKLSGGAERSTTEATVTGTVAQGADATSTASITINGQTLTLKL